MKKDCFNNFKEKKAIARWTSQEQQILREITSEILPKNENDWRKVIERMQSFSYNRTVRACKQKVQNLLKDRKNIEFKKDRAIIQRIINLFSQGKSTAIITKICSSFEIDVIEIRKFLTSKFKTIEIVLTKILGNTQAEGLNLKNYELFEFAHSQNILTFDLLNIVDLADRWNQLQKGKYKTDKTLEALCQIQKSLLNFNLNLKQLKLKYQASLLLKAKNNLQKNVKKQQNNPQESFTFLAITGLESNNSIQISQTIDEQSYHSSFGQSSFKNHQDPNERTNFINIYNPEDISIFFQKQRCFNFFQEEQHEFFS